MYKIEITETFPKFKEISTECSEFKIIFSNEKFFSEAILNDDIEKYSDKSLISAIFDLTNLEHDKKSKDKKEEKLIVKLYKKEILIGENEVFFSFDSKNKNNVFRKWLNFNLNNNTIPIPSKTHREKDGKRGSLSGSFLNFSEFLKIHITITKLNEITGNEITIPRAKDINKINEPKEQPVNLEVVNDFKTVDANNNKYINIQENADINDILNIVENQKFENEIQNKAEDEILTNKDISNNKSNEKLENSCSKPKKISSLKKGDKNLKFKNNSIITFEKDDENADLFKDNLKRDERKNKIEHNKNQKLLEKIKKNYQIITNTAVTTAAILHKKDTPNSTRNANDKKKKFDLSQVIIKDINNEKNDNEIRTQYGSKFIQSDKLEEKEKMEIIEKLANEEEKIGEIQVQNIDGNIPEKIESSLIENQILLFAENNKNLEILENKNHLEILDGEGEEDVDNRPKTEVTPEKIELKEYFSNQPLETEKNISRKKDVNNNKNYLIENVNNFIKNKNTIKNKMPKKENTERNIKKNDVKRLKDLLNEKNIEDEKLLTENNIDINDIKNKILNNTNKVKDLKELRASINKINFGPNVNSEKQTLQASDFNDFYNNINQNMKNGTNSKFSNLKGSGMQNKLKNVKLLQTSDKKNSIKNNEKNSTYKLEEDDVESEMDSFLDDDYARKKKLDIDYTIPFDELGINEFNQEYEKFKQYVDFQKIREYPLDEQKLREELKLLVEKLKDFQICYHKNMNVNVKNNQNLKSILKENTEKLMTMRKKLEKLNRIADQNEIKKKFENLNEAEKIFIEKSIIINNQEKNLYKNLLGNFIEKNEAHVSKLENTKNAMIQILGNLLDKTKIDDLSKKSDIRSGLLYLSTKFKFGTDEKNDLDDLLQTRHSEELITGSPKIKLQKDQLQKSADSNKNEKILNLTNDIMTKLNAKERNSILNKNSLETKLLGIYLSSPNLPQLEFKKINETDYLYGTMKITVNIESRNSSNVTVSWRKNNVVIVTSLEEFLKVNSEIEDEKIKKADPKYVKKSNSKKI